MIPAHQKLNYQGQGKAQAHHLVMVCQLTLVGGAL